MKQCGAARAEALFVTNPGAILKGEAVDRVEAEPITARKWYQFWG